MLSIAVITRSIYIKDMEITMKVEGKYLMPVFKDIKHKYTE